MKKILALILCIVMLAGIMTSCGKDNGNEQATTTEYKTEAQVPQVTDSPIADSPVEDFYYEERDNNGITIIRYRGTDEHVVIPSKINNVPVTVINTGAFLNSVNLKSVVIPESVEIIEDMVFNTCTNLTSFVVKEGNKNYSSDDGVLYNKDKSQIVLFPICKQDMYIIPSCVKSIREYAFYGCLNLKSITITSDIESIGSQAFVACTSLIDINVDPDNKFYSSLNGVLYNKNQTKIISVPGGKTGIFEIPSSVTEIGAYAFSACKSITNIKIPESVTSIGEWAFSKCSALKDITIPSGIKEIPQSLFNGCTSLTGVVIPESVIKIDEMVFYNCANLSDIELPSGLLSIGSRAFFGCIGLSDIIIHENVETVGAVLFQECTHVNIYVKQESQPIGWDSSWNHLNFPVVWGYTGS